MIILENVFKGSWGGGRLVTPSDIRGTLFYDYNNTAYYLDPNASGTSLNAYGKKYYLGTSRSWDTLDSTRVFMNGHAQFWMGAGNGTWFTGTANSKSQASGLAADASTAHDLLITTMQSTSTYDRGITFAVDSTGSQNSGWRLGKWHSGDARDSSMLAVDGMLRVHGAYTDEYDYYTNDYSAYYSNGQSYWAGDTNAGWHRPSATLSTALQIQSGNSGTNTRKPQIQFHQYGYGGMGLEYDGVNKTFTMGELGTSTQDRVNTFNWRFDNTVKARINSAYMWHNSDMRSPIFYDSNNTGYFLHPDTSSESLVIRGSIRMEQGNTCTKGIELNSVKDSTWPFEFTTNDVGNDNSSGFWVGSNGYPDMRLRRDSGTVVALISSWEQSYVSNGFRVEGTTDLNGDLFVGSGTSSNIYMTDTDHGQRRIHCNSNRIGFLNEANGWGLIVVMEVIGILINPSVHPSFTIAITQATFLILLQDLT